MFDVVYQHDDFLVINKHPNISVHKDDNIEPFLTFVAKQTGNSMLYLVHRLDKMTSGLLLLALNPQMASYLSALFAQKKIEKFYLALSHKKPNKKQGLIIGDMVKARRGSWMLSSTRHNPATTQFFSTALEQGGRIFLCKPRTGKTHQIRVALKSIGCPILGDIRYGGKEADRGYLHAFSLAFCYKERNFHFVLPPTQGVHWQSLPSEWMQPYLLAWPKLPQAV